MLYKNSEHTRLSCPIGDFGLCFGRRGASLLLEACPLCRAVSPGAHTTQALGLSRLPGCSWCPEGRALLISVCTVARSDLCSVDVSRKAQADKRMQPMWQLSRVLADRAEQLVYSSEKMLHLQGGVWAPRSIPWSTPAFQVRWAQYFKALYHLKFMGWQRHDPHFTDGKLDTTIVFCRIFSCRLFLSPAVGPASSLALCSGSVQ